MPIYVFRSEQKNGCFRRDVRGCDRRIAQWAATMVEYLRTSLELKADRRGLVALEYALMAGLLAVAVLAASSILGGSLENAFNAIANLL